MDNSEKTIVLALTTIIVVVSVWYGMQDFMWLSNFYGNTPLTGNEFKEFLLRLIRFTLMFKVVSGLCKVKIN